MTRTRTRTHPPGGCGRGQGGGGGGAGHPRSPAFGHRDLPGGAARADGRHPYLHHTVGNGVATANAKQAKQRNRQQTVPICARRKDKRKNGRVKHTAESIETFQGGRYTGSWAPPSPQPRRGDLRPADAPNESNADTHGNTFRTPPNTSRPSRGRCAGHLRLPSEPQPELSLSLAHSNQSRHKKRKVYKNLNPRLQVGGGARPDGGEGGCSGTERERAGVNNTEFNSV